MQVETITSEETLRLRSVVLREGAAQKKCRFYGDDANDSLHLGVRQNGEVIAIASLISIDQHDMNIDLSADKVWQLRGMAVHPDHQGDGLGSMLVKAAWNRSRSAGKKAIFCNARERAVTLYLKHGYQHVAHGTIEGGAGFLISGIGIHYRMIKWV